MKSIVMILISAWVLLVAPALCMSGVLIHACDWDNFCGHESDCEADPCDVIAVRASGSDAEDTPIPMVNRAFVDIVVTTESRGHELHQAPVETSLVGVPNLPQPASGLPLLC